MPAAEPLQQAWRVESVSQQRQRARVQMRHLKHTQLGQLQRGARQHADHAKLPCLVLCW